MAKSRKSKSVLKSIKKTTEQALPVINKGLTTVGSTTKKVVTKSAPIVERGVSAIYGTMATGFDLGIKGAKTVASGVKNVTKKSRKSRRTRKSRRSRRH